MKKILGIVASPRKLGNCELIVKEIYKHIEFECELELLRLTDFEIDSCRGCYRCLFKNENCIIDDDLCKIFEPIINSDAIILSAPTYFLGSHSSLKRILDRGLSLYSKIDQLWGKPSVGVAVAGIKGKEGSTLLGIQNFLKVMLSNVRSVEVVYGAMPGEVLLNKKNKEIAKLLGNNLFNDKDCEKKGPICNLCKGDTFRFIDNDYVRCMLCSNTGKLKLLDGKFVASIARDDHQFFLTKEDVVQHKKWLIDMKSKFISMHKVLSATVKNYKFDGKWIKP